jgi:hypothetical protein
MSAQSPLPVPESPASLRAALFPPNPPQRTRPAAVPPGTAGQPAHGAALLPTAPELLAASPNLQRLCESYHNTRRRMVERGRRQRLGIAAMVCGLAVASFMLFRNGSLADTTVTLLMVTVGLASTAGLVVLGMLWLRQDRMLRAAQGDRLQRALQFNCTLPEESLVAFRRLVQPQQAFFDVYAVWRVEHPDQRSALSTLLGSLTGTRRPASA